MTESEIISLFNIRNIRLVTVELGVNTEDLNLQRISNPFFTNSIYHPVSNTDDLNNLLDNAGTSILEFLKENSYESLNIPVRLYYL